MAFGRRRNDNVARRKIAPHLVGGGRSEGLFAPALWRYGLGMTRLLEQAVATVSALPDDVQDELARMLLQCLGTEPLPDELTPEEHADLDASLAAEARGEFATDEQVRAIWAKHGR